MDGFLDVSATGRVEVTFAEVTELYRSELQTHCHRLLGSHEDSEDVVQETFLRAWRHLDTFQGRSSFRTWLYKIATNACFDALQRRRRILPAEGASRPAEGTWHRPSVDPLREPVAPSEAEPESRLIAKDTTELALSAVIQLVPPRQRGVLIARDMLGWSSAECAALLGVSVAAVNSRLQRARAKLKRQLPGRALDWPTVSRPSATERALLRRYMEATDQGNRAALVRLLREDDRAASRPDWSVRGDAVAAA